MPIEHRAGGSWRGSRVPRARRGTAWGNVCDLFLPNLWGHTLAINRRTHSSPPASGDSDDRIDMALLNFEKDPAEVRAADPRELLARARGDFGDTASSPGRKRVSTESRFCGFRRKNDGHDNLNLDFRVLIVPGVRGVSGGVQAFKRVCRRWTSCAVIFGGAPKNGAASQTRSFTFRVQSVIDSKVTTPRLSANPRRWLAIY